MRFGKSNMKLLVVASSLDLQQPFSSTPSWWQLLKGLYEEGVDLVVTTYQGPAIETLWWRAVPNPVKTQGDVFKWLRDTARQVMGPPKPVQVKDAARDAAPDSGESLSERALRVLAQKTIAPRWQAALDRLLTAQPDIDAVLFLTIPLNHVSGVPAYLIAKHGKPVFYHDGDLPASLPQFKGFATGFRIYQGADPGEYTAVLGSSIEGLEYVKALGARHVHTFQYAADPEVWAPLPVAQDVDTLLRPRQGVPRGLDRRHADPAQPGLAGAAPPPCAAPNWATWAASSRCRTCPSASCANTPAAAASTW